MNALVAGDDLGDGSRPLEPGSPDAGSERAPLDREGHVAVDLGQMPGQLADRAGAGIGAEVVLGFGERAQQLQRLPRLTIPRVDEAVELATGHALPPGRWPGRI